MDTNIPPVDAMPINETDSDSNIDIRNQFLSIDDVQRWADKKNRYERIVVWFWLLPVTVTVPCAYMNVMLATYIPFHECSIHLNNSYDNFGPNNNHLKEAAIPG